MNENSPAKMTELSRVALKAAMQWGQTPEEAADALERIPIRTFVDVLHAAAPDVVDLRETLVSGLCVNDEGADRATIDRNVRNWLSGRVMPTKREKLFELCFVLNMDLKRADDFLAVAGETGIHWRDAREMVYGYALREGMTWREAQALMTRVLPEPPREEKTRDGEKSSEDGKKKRGGKPKEVVQPARNELTQLMKRDAGDIAGEDELREYLLENAERMSAMHNTAYRYFNYLMEMVKNPNVADEQNAYSIKEVIEKYLYAIPTLARKEAEGRPCMESIMKAWPNESMFSRMKTRTVDVSRKALLLLFIATDGEDAYDEAYAEAAGSARAQANAAFKATYIRINTMLGNCGYHRLDPRNPFDWVILYCLRVNSADEFEREALNERLGQVLELLFADYRTAPKAEKD